MAANIFWSIAEVGRITAGSFTDFCCVWAKKQTVV